MRCQCLPTSQLARIWYITRDILDGPGNIAVNLALHKNFVVREKSHVQFRWELFNVLN